MPIDKSSIRAGVWLEAAGGPAYGKGLSSPPPVRYGTTPPPASSLAALITKQTDLEKRLAAIVEQVKRARAKP
jgi:hypothetical protein